jgi:hypothetical protein
MSDLSKGIFLKKPNLTSVIIKNCPNLAIKAYIDQNKSLVSSYIRQFDKLNDAKANLTSKMRTRYLAKYPNRKRDPGIKANLDKL